MLAATCVVLLNNYQTGRFHFKTALLFNICLHTLAIACSALSGDCAALSVQGCGEVCGPLILVCLAGAAVIGLVLLIPNALK
jgi:hypothetical protein